MWQIVLWCAPLCQSSWCGVCPPCAHGAHGVVCPPQVLMVCQIAADMLIFLPLISIYQEVL